MEWDLRQDKDISTLPHENGDLFLTAAAAWIRMDPDRDDQLFQGGGRSINVLSLPCLIFFFSLWTLPLETLPCLFPAPAWVMAGNHLKSIRMEIGLTSISHDPSPSATCLQLKHGDLASRSFAEQTAADACFLPLKLGQWRSMGVGPGPDQIINLPNNQSSDFPNIWQ